MNAPTDRVPATDDHNATNFSGGSEQQSSGQAQDSSRIAGETATLFSRRRQLLARKNRLAGKPSDALAETLTELIAVSSACEPMEVSA